MCLKAFVDSSVNKRRLAIEELSSKISEAVLSSPSHVGLPVGLGVPSLIKCHDITFNTNHELSHTFIGSCFVESETTSFLLMTLRGQGCALISLKKLERCVIDGFGSHSSIDTLHKSSTPINIHTLSRSIDKDVACQPTQFWC